MKNLPEKIYVTPNFDRRWQTVAIDDESMEYVRKDAFIEKAYTYLNEKCRRFILTEKDIEDFIDYMKGE